jgi:hypothetical protein
LFGVLESQLRHLQVGSLLVQPESLLPDILDHLLLEEHLLVEEHQRKPEVHHQMEIAEHQVFDQKEIAVHQGPPVVAPQVALQLATAL